MKRLAIVGSAVLGLVLIASSTARCDPLADFYRGKTIELAIGAAAAGGYDIAGRTIANHMSRHIPGNPGIVVRNMPGAAGLIATNYLYNVGQTRRHRDWHADKQRSA